MRVTVLTSEERRRPWAQSLDGIAEVTFRCPAEGEFGEAFFDAAGRKADSAAFSDAVIVDGCGLPSFSEVSTALFRFARIRTSRHPAQVIVVCPETLEPGPMTHNLATVGYFDIIAPATAPEGERDTEPFRLAPRFLRERATFRWPYELGLVNAPFLDALDSADRVWEEASSGKRTSPRTIAVAGIAPRCGCTTFAMALASSIAIAGKSASIVMNEADHRLISTAFRGAPNEQGAVRFRPASGRKGCVDVYPIIQLAPIIHSADRNPFVIFDLGTAPVDVLLDRNGSKAREAFYTRWATASDRVLVTGSGARDLFTLGKAVSAMRQRGVSADVFANLCPDSMLKTLRDGFSEVPGITFAGMDAVMGPLFLTEAPAFLKDWAADRGIKLKGRA